MFFFNREQFTIRIRRYGRKMESMIDACDELVGQAFVLGFVGRGLSVLVILHFITLHGIWWALVLVCFVLLMYFEVRAAYNIIEDSPSISNSSSQLPK